jgi:Na+/H+-dicarboxylate symporter
MLVRRRGVSLTPLIFLGLAIGVAVGWVVQQVDPTLVTWIRPLSLFLRLVKMIVAPIIFASHGRGHRRRRPPEGRGLHGPARAAVLRGRHHADELMDMARTVTNVIGNCLATVVINRWEGEAAL